MRNSLRFIAVVALALGVVGCSVHMVTLANDPGNQLLNRSKIALCLPVDTIHVTYVDNTKAIADTLFNDSFFIEAANSLLLYEAAKNFPLRQLGAPQGASKDTSVGADSLAAFRHGGYSRLTHDTASLPLIAGFVRDLSKKYNADLVIVPYAYVVRNVVIRPAGWRNDKFAGPGYDRPVSYTAKTEFHVQIWDKSGALLYERIGKSDTGRPILYSLMKKEKHADKDIVKYAKRFYAPPLVKSLYNSIKAALQVRT
jgi:hypothetical protein